MSTLKTEEPTNGESLGEDDLSLVSIQLRPGPQYAQARKSHLDGVEALCKKKPPSTISKKMFFSELGFFAYTGKFSDSVLSEIRKESAIIIAVDGGAPVTLAHTERRETKNWALKAISNQSEGDYWFCPSNGGENVTIYIVDHYFDDDYQNEPQFRGKKVDFMGNEEGISYEVPHGLLVAMSAGGISMGSAPKCDLTLVETGSLDHKIGKTSEKASIKVLEALADVFERIRDQETWGSSIVNCSWSMSTNGYDGTTLVDFIKLLAQKLILVCAAGNDGILIPENHVPAALGGDFGGPICVGAVNQDGLRYNTDVDIYAPGEDITYPMLNDTFITESGTSMATPLVAGILACWIGANNAQENSKPLDAVACKERLRLFASRYIAEPSNPKERYATLKLFVKARRRSVSLLPTAGVQNRSHPEGLLDQGDLALVAIQLRPGTQFAQARAKHVERVELLCAQNPPSKMVERMMIDSLGYYGYTGEFSPLLLREIRKDDAIIIVVDHGVPLVSAFTERRFTQNWALSAVSNDTLPYWKCPSNGGANLSIYIVDAGFGPDPTKEPEFKGKDVEILVEDPPDTQTQHGLRVAQLAGGIESGSAPKCKLILVSYEEARREWENSTSNSALPLFKRIWANIFDRGEEKKSVINCSWSIEVVDSRGTALRNLLRAIAERTIFVCAAQNNGIKVHERLLPASMGGPKGKVITVGAVDESNHISGFSNWGSSVDIYAPGENIIFRDSFGRSPDVIESGTSLAAPLVAGILACWIGDHNGDNKDPTFMDAEMCKSRLRVSAVYVSKRFVPLSHMQEYATLKLYAKARRGSFSLLSQSDAGN